MANHASTCATRLDDGRRDEVSLDESSGFRDLGEGIGETLTARGLRRCCLFI